MKPTFCSIITIGDELLIGHTIDTNSSWIAQQLNPLGIQIKRRIAIADNKNDIIETIDAERKKSSIIILTGGLGPTSDDITKQTLCEYFNSELVENKKVTQHIVSYFSKRKRPMLDVNLQQAFVPDCCEVLFNELGTAPGMLFKQKKHAIISLPGVPYEMQFIMTNHVIPFLLKNIKKINYLHRTIVTCGEGESYIAERLKEFEAKLPQEIKLAYLPNINIVKLRLTASNIDEDILNTYFETLKNFLQNITVADSNIELENVILNLLKEKNKTLSIAESCTGGTISSKITSVKGASKYFKGGLIPYTIESKEQVLQVDKKIIKKYGVVSKETVVAMAVHCSYIYKSDFAISVSGYLEKDDHDNVVWIGLTNNKITEAIKIIAPYEREKNAQFVSNIALNLLRKFILKNE